MMKTEQEIREEIERHKALSRRFKVTYPDVAMYHDLNVATLAWVLNYE
jgi:hypothetical protein